MEPFVTHAGRAVPLRRSNVDTDQIIPAEYLKQVSRTGFGKGLFAAWREDPSFVLNQPQYEGATILVAGTDFGTGSSREHAVWALTDYGFRAVIAPRFGDIFRGNSTKAGLLPVVLPEATVAALQDAVEAEPATEIVVDLDHRLVTAETAGISRVFRDRRLHPLAADGGPGRHRPDPPPRRRHHRLRALPPQIPPRNRLTRPPGTAAQGAPAANHGDVTSPWSGPPRCDIAVVPPRYGGLLVVPVSMMCNVSR
jgi:3-isopropylmalate/(R)-2-methylmalate dehydratase small subunit